MTWDVLVEKVESIRRCLERISTRIPDSAEEFSVNLDAQDIVSINLERAIQLCVDIAASILSELSEETGTTMASLFDALANRGIIDRRLSTQLMKAVGFRNILVHQYKRIEWDKVYEFAKVDLANIKEFVAVVISKESPK